MKLGFACQSRCSLFCMCRQFLFIVENIAKTVSWDVRFLKKRSYNFQKFSAVDRRDVGGEVCESEDFEAQFKLKIQLFWKIFKIFVDAM